MLDRVTYCPGGEKAPPKMEEQPQTVNGIGMRKARRNHLVISLWETIMIMTDKYNGREYWCFLNEAGCKVELDQQKLYYSNMERTQDV